MLDSDIWPAEKTQWTICVQVSVVGIIPEARELHSAAMVGKYLVVSKGITDPGQNNVRPLVDTLVSFCVLCS